jgi:hypothetical protein
LATIVPTPLLWNVKVLTVPRASFAASRARLVKVIETGLAALGAVVDPDGPGAVLFEGVVRMPDEVGPEATSEALGCVVSPGVPDL